MKTKAPTDMKKRFVIPFAAFLALAVPAFSQSNAQYCFGSSPFTCQYLADNALEQGTTHWGYSSGSGQSNVSDPCAWGGGTTGAADLDPGDSVYQSFDTDAFAVWKVRLDLYKTSTSVTWNDYFEVILHNYTTNVSETHYVYANSFSGLCGSVITIYLANDYSSSNTRIRIKKNFYATATMYVDNVSLFGSPY